MLVIWLKLLDKSRDGSLGIGTYRTDCIRGSIPHIVVRVVQRFRTGQAALHADQFSPCLAALVAILLQPVGIGEARQIIVGVVADFGEQGFGGL